MRFDSMLYATKTRPDFDQVLEKYPAYSDLYFHRILSLDRQNNPDTLFNQVQKMVSSKAFVEIGRKGHEQYDEIDDIVRDWRQAMKYYTHYFEPESVPDLYTTITEFAFGSFIFPLDENKDAVGVSVDMFLGDSLNYSSMAKTDPSFSAYNSRSFNRDHFVKRAVDAIIDDLIEPAKGAEFLPHLLREGKKYYVSSRLLPFVSDTAIWEYTSEQMTWVKENEWNIYSHLISNELFYSKNRSKYIRLITASPSSPEMPPEAPGRTAIYIGYKIIERYMERHPETTMSEMLALDANTLFQAAKYKPKER